MTATSGVSVGFSPACVLCVSCGYSRHEISVILYEGSSEEEEAERVDQTRAYVAQKRRVACSNCRRAKQKCITEEGLASCVRCQARAEICSPHARVTAEDLHRLVTVDLQASMRHLRDLSCAVHHILLHLTKSGQIPAFSGNLPSFGGSSHQFHENVIAEGIGQKRSAPDVPAFCPPKTPKNSRKTASHTPRSYSAPADGAGINSGSDDTDTRLQPGSHTRLGGRDMDPNINSDFSVPGRLGLGMDWSTAVFDKPLFATTSMESTGHISSDPGAEMSLFDRAPQTACGLDIVGGTIPIEHVNLHHIRQAVNSEILKPTTPRTPILGEADPRPNVLSKRILNAAEAYELVTCAHSRLIAFLNGFTLEFGSFPYLEAGPTHITPFIFSVLCLLSAERLPRYEGVRLGLRNEVKHLWVNNPTDNIFSTILNAASGSPLPGIARIDEDEDSGDVLDLELGIGPEEIIGACILAIYTEETTEARATAALAFRWARGWVKWTSSSEPLPPTLGEICGVLPVKRLASPKQMARVWLLCYVVTAFENTMSNDSFEALPNPNPFCRLLEQDPMETTTVSDARDVLLTSSARLASILQDWFENRLSLVVSKPSEKDISSGLARLTAKTNISLEWWNTDVAGHELNDEMRRDIDRLRASACLIINRGASRDLKGHPRLAAASTITSGEAAVELLQISCAYSDDQWAFVTSSHLRIVSIATKFIKRSARSASEHTWLQREEVCDMLNQLASKPQNWQDQKPHHLALFQALMTRTAIEIRAKDSSED